MHYLKYSAAGVPYFEKSCAFALSQKLLSGKSFKSFYPSLQSSCILLLSLDIIKNYRFFSITNFISRYIVTQPYLPYIFGIRPFIEFNSLRHRLHIYNKRLNVCLFFFLNEIFKCILMSHKSSNKVNTIPSNLCEFDLM